MVGASPVDEPQPDYQTEDGRQFYSAEQQKAWHKWNDARLEQEWSKRLTPLEEQHKRLGAKDTPPLPMGSMTTEVPPGVVSRKLECPSQRKLTATSR